MYNRRKKHNARQGRQGEFCLKEAETGPKGHGKKKRVKAGLQGGQGEVMRSLPLTLQGCDMDITSSCAGPQNITGKEQDYEKGMVGDDGESEPHNILSYVQQPATDQGRATRGPEDLTRWQPALLTLWKPAGHGAPETAGGGRDRPVWRPAARAGVG